MEIRSEREGRGRRSVEPEGGKKKAVVAREGERGGGERVDEGKGGKNRSGKFGRVGDAAAHGDVAEDDAASRAENEVVAQTWKVPDGGWGWVVVLSAMVVSLIVDGLSYTFGLFLGEFERAFNQPKSTVALACSLQVGIYLFLGPVVSALTNRFGCRPVIVAGSCLAGLAFIASSRSTDVTTLILTYGVLAGVGFGLMYLPAIVAVSIYFEKRRAVATGIAVCGSGVGTFMLAPLTDYLLSEYNWRWTLLILAGIVLNGAVFGALVRPLKLERVEPVRVTDVDKNAGANGASLICPKRDVKEGLEISYNGRTKKEEVPLISLTDKMDDVQVAMSPGMTDTNQNQPQILFFSSTPAMTVSPATAVPKVEVDKSNTVPSLPLIKPRDPPRRRTQSTSDHTHPTSVARARWHAPIGLALISLSDVNLDQIRADVHLPLSRKDIHLSGPLHFQESDPTVDRSDRNQGLYIQSIQSITSLSVAGLEEIGNKSHGLLSCLPRSARETLEEMLDLGILKEKRLWFVLLGNFLCMLGMYVPFVYVPERALQLGIPEDKAAFLISIIGITNTLGRILTGGLINFFNLDCATVTTCALLIAGITTATTPFCHTYPALAAMSTIYGICFAAYISLCSVLLCELFGVESLTNAFGFVILFRGMACMVGPPIAGAIIDATGLFDHSFYVAGGVIVLGALSHALLLIPCTRGGRSG